jgi:hypothetical protein
VQLLVLVLVRVLVVLVVVVLPALRAPFMPPLPAPPPVPVPVPLLLWSPSPLRRQLWRQPRYTAFPSGRCVLTVRKQHRLQRPPHLLPVLPVGAPLLLRPRLRQQ